ncbi:MAG TPA: LytTR family DNA-binding domain-containing protein [Gemmatimonadaceae bacterium]|jgi:two-component system LytT family response regulator
MKVRTAVVDDEPIARSGLRALLARVDWIDVVAEAANGPDAVDIIDRVQPDLVFLDIQMPGLSGIDVLRRARHAPHVVFTTAYAQHAVVAFELGALDYILKPFGWERLSTALERSRAAIGEPVSSPAADRLAEALGKGPMSRLFVRSGPAIIPVPVGDVAWFQADGDYVVAHTGRARHVMHVSLNRLESRLDPVRFARIHRAHIVNLDHVTAFRPQVKGRLVAQLRDGSQLSVSRARARELRSLGR